MVFLDLFVLGYFPFQLANHLFRSFPLLNGLLKFILFTLDKVLIPWHHCFVICFWNWFGRRFVCCTLSQITLCCIWCSSGLKTTTNSFGCSLRGLFLAWQKRGYCTNYFASRYDSTSWCSDLARIGGLNFIWHSLRPLRAVIKQWLLDLVLQSLILNTYLHAHIQCLSQLPHHYFNLDLSLTQLLLQVSILLLYFWKSILQEFFRL